jgi:hypothetical protein
MSSLELELFESPTFRSGVRLVFDTTGVECEYREQSCRIDFGSQPEARQLVELLAEGGCTRGELERRLPSLADAIPEVIRELDAQGLLTESRLPEPDDVVSGLQFYREARRVMERQHDRVMPGSFHRAMVEGTITREQLIGYALEYYHLVHLAPRLVASALAKEEPGRTSELLQDFFVSELHHDRMLEAALQAVSIEPWQLRRTQPLPATFSLCASLGAYSAQNPLTFKTMLYLFEESSPAFNAAFASACEALGLPAAFARPILAHAKLNDDGDHGDISATLLAEVPAVGPEERHTALKHLAIVVETLAIQEDQMLAYYARPDALIPRVFEEELVS